MSVKRIAIFKHDPGRQRGAALLIMLVILVVGAAAVLINSLTSSAVKTARQTTTAAALAQAREALIGRAIKDVNRPGSLPCPDTNNNGSADLFISGNQCPNYVGRLPWKTLGLPDLRDGDGERLWYALSPTVRDYSSSTQSVNSDTPSQFNIIGNVTMNNVVAIVFSPGAVLSSPSQVRDTANENNVANYLEGNNATNGAIINADIAGGTYSSTSIYTFTANASSSTFNDSVLGITADQVFPIVEKRIAKEVSNCLQDYSGTPANLGRYPWATPLNSTNYLDANNTWFGRLPSPLPVSVINQLSVTRANSGNAMNDQWPSTAACNSVAAWWANWKELIFYSVADDYSPNGYPAPAGCNSTCLIVNPPSATRDKKIMVIVAGKALPGQARTTITDKATVSNYLEGNNATGAVTAANTTGNTGGTFEQSPRSTAFNDTLLYQ